MTQELGNVGTALSGRKYFTVAGYISAQLGSQYLEFSDMGAYGDEGRMVSLDTRFGAIRFSHLLEEKGDSEGKSFRVRALIEVPKCMSGVSQRLPLNPEMLGNGRSELNPPAPDGCEIWADAMIGFRIALRLGETEKLEDKDIACETVGGGPCIAIHIIGSKQISVNSECVETLCALVVQCARPEGFPNG